MIRKLVAVLLIGTGVSACASGKVETGQTVYAPAQFIITDVTVDVEAQPRPDRSFVRLTRSAAENLRQAYNKEMVRSVGSYTLEFSVQELAVSDANSSLAPITNNSVSLIATVRHPESGIAMRQFPVKYQLVREIKDETREEQLLRGALPAAFNGVYGMVATPQSIQPIVKSNQIFDGLDAEPVSVASAPRPVSPPPVPVKQNEPVQDVSTTAQGSGEPAVIECAIC
ncbi:MAG: hypothetical protein QNJ29_07845 [Rhizobiaceae bacterium]|nr:hypothetical protein [Rhizobiaceae bacterium]